MQGESCKPQMQDVFKFLKKVDRLSVYIVINIDNRLYRMYPSRLSKEQTESGDISTFIFYCCEQFENLLNLITPLNTFSHFRCDQAVLIRPFTYQNVQSNAFS